jgi:hypothetical protein
MNTVASSDPRIEHVRVTEDEIIAQLVDGRVISVPLAWSWRLAEATAAQPGGCQSCCGPHPPRSEQFTEASGDGTDWKVGGNP